MQNAWWRQSKHSHFGLLRPYLPFHDDCYEMGDLHQCINITYICQIDCLRFLLAFIILLQRMPESYRQATMHDP